MCMCEEIAQPHICSTLPSLSDSLLHGHPLLFSARRHTSTHILAPRSMAAMDQLHLLMQARLLELQAIYLEQQWVHTIMKAFLWHHHSQRRRISSNISPMQQHHCPRPTFQQQGQQHNSSRCLPSMLPTTRDSSKR